MSWSNDGGHHADVADTLSAFVADTRREWLTLCSRLQFVVVSVHYMHGSRLKALDNAYLAAP